VSPSRPKQYRVLSPPGSERGSATIVAASMMVAVLAVTVGAVHVGSAVVARHRAQAAADMAAVAAATIMPVGPGAACERASAVARAMSTTVTACDTDSLDVTVTVGAPLALTAWGVGPAHAVARAGPATADFVATTL
jgi:secretion/DNA translocation related TadE-like protein